MALLRETNRKSVATTSVPADPERKTKTVVIQNNMTDVNKAMAYAIKCAEDTNHKYNGHPYEVHLRKTVDVALRFIDLIPEDDRSDVVSACWCHDVIEDNRETYGDVKNN